MSKERAAFLIHFSHARMFGALNDEQLGALFRGMLVYARDGIEPEFQPGTAEAISFECVRDTIDHDTETYYKNCERQREKVQKRWAKQKEAVQTDSTAEYQAIPQYTTEYHGIPGYTEDTNLNLNLNLNSNLNSSNCVTTNKQMSMVAQAWEQNIGAISRAVYDKLLSQLEEFPADLIIEAINTAALNEKKTWAYVGGILKRCREKNIYTVDAYRTEQSKHKAEKRVTGWTDKAREQGRVVDRESHSGMDILSQGKRKPIKLKREG